MNSNNIRHENLRYHDHDKLTSITMAKYIRTLTVIFNLDIKYKEIPLFRGAVLHSMGNKADLLYHNHTGTTTFRYSYPLIQYKRLGGKAAIVCVEEGADVIGQYLSECPNSIKLGEREVECITDRISPVRMKVQTWHSTFKYHISRWLPLNTKNYHIYRMTDNEEERKALLENVLRGNLLSMLKGLGVRIEDELRIEIIQVEEPYILYNKGIAMMAFNADFTCNLSIPNNVSVGKNASIGFGVVWLDRKNETEKR